MSNFEPKSFRGATSKEALKRTREELGEDAAILQNNTLPDGGVEIIAIAGRVLATNTKPSANEARSVQAPSPIAASAKARYVEGQADFATPAPTRASNHTSTSASPTPSGPAHEMSAARPQPHAHAHTTKASADQSPSSEQRAPSDMRSPSIVIQSSHQAEQADNKPNEQALMDEMKSELKAMRGLLEDQMATMTLANMQRTDPGKITVVKTMLNAGFSTLLARTLCQYTKSGTDVDAVLKTVKLGLARNLRVAGIEPLQEGGIFALVGPTGVGKTTTTAKLAARAGIVKGPRSFALLTTDSYRLAAEEQLAAFGRILGAPVHRVNDHSDLKALLYELTTKQVILIDTVGTSQKDRKVAEQLSMLNNIQNMKRILVLNASSSGTALEEIVTTYLRLGPLSGAILTKIDEATHIGTSLDVLIRKKLPLLYVTTGQRVPDDIETPEPQKLIEQAFRQGAIKTPFGVTNFEVFVDNSSR